MAPYICTGLGSDIERARNESFRQGLKLNRGLISVGFGYAPSAERITSKVSPDLVPHPANVGRPKRWEFSSSKTGGEDVYCVPSSSSSSSCTFGRHVLCPISREV